ncbi:MAG: lysozyme inhibitor LprI family protein [Atlantibacter hermannii]|uniref:lysozyme inhibitor LprI family protein n=1 Tax=Atlantibacter hermannii TaxID=565 RepID=UPI00291229E9|nr:lysozyme inhibitor LprI family protein [Atlantibacter hermannii]MDU7812949.1 lysozyme inhibitor LprI family protein [Atlantibacter hermannii]
MRIKHTTLVFLLLVTGSAFADTIGQDIDSRLVKCKNDAVTTIDSQNCYSYAFNEWDAELSKQYKLLLKGQPENVRTALRDSQRLWIKYKDSYSDAMNKFYQQEQGTIWGLIAAESRMNITRDKALDLYRLRNSTNLGG